MEAWIHEWRSTHWIACASMHGMVEAQRDPTFGQALKSADMVVPDGAPLMWLGRRRGHNLTHRVYAADLVLAFCKKTAGQGYKHFFYGGEPGTPEQLAESLQQLFPSMQVSGTFSPPFRPLNKQEDEEIMAMIRRAAPDVLWMGLGAPKQEHWMQEHRNRLNVPVMVGVGAAFDWLSGRKAQAPRWMREHGLEWLFRLFQEPRRLWRRYLVYGAEFVGWTILESLGLRKFEPSAGNSKPQADSLT